MLKRRRWLLLLLILPIVAAVGFVIWANAGPDPMPRALEALEDGAAVAVSTDRWLVFESVDGEADIGLVFYPGGRVDPRAYAPPMRALAEEGVQTVIVPMPLNLAVLAPNRAADVTDAYPEIDQWAVGGHSLGGAMAARFAHQRPGAVGGLVLWVSYPAQNDDLSGRDLEVTSIYGTRDGLAAVETVVDSSRLLPPDTEWVRIEGGNHAQFGWYGTQSGDEAATISREEQQEIVISATLDLLQSLKEDGE